MDTSSLLRVRRMAGIARDSHGLIAKEEVISTFGVIFSIEDAIGIVEEGDFAGVAAIAQHFTQLSAFSFMLFNLFCPPCFAAMGAIKREMNSAKWTWFAIGYLFVFAYILSFIVSGRTSLHGRCVQCPLGSGRRFARGVALPLVQKSTSRRCTCFGLTAHTSGLGGSLRHLTQCPPVKRDLPKSKLDASVLSLYWQCRHHPYFLGNRRVYSPSPRFPRLFYFKLARKEILDGSQILSIDFSR